MNKLHYYSSIWSLSFPFNAVWWNRNFTISSRSSFVFFFCFSLWLLFHSLSGLFCQLQTHNDDLSPTVTWDSSYSAWLFNIQSIFVLFQEWIRVFLKNAEAQCAPYTSINDLLYFSCLRSNKVIQLTGMTALFGFQTVDSIKTQR